MVAPAADPARTIPVLARTIPVLPSPDIAVSRDFYRDQLGFDVIGPEMEDYLIVRRAARCRALYAEFSARGVERLSAFTVRPWNMKEFYIRDPHGNLLEFGCAPEEV
jgi:catechol 2,3-dioxygenase-like lactoylglutathione lyase family enzyme